MSNEDATAGLSPPPDPAKDRSGKPVPERIAFVLNLVRILLAYGRHLADTLEHRAALRTFSLIAQCFGTRRLGFILPRLARGIMRAVALEHVLLARAARGRDLVPRNPNEYRPRRPPEAKQETGAQSRKHRRVPRPDPDQFLDFDSLPGIGQLEAEIRRRGIGRTIAAICTDLGINPALCEGNFGTELYQAMSWYRGNFCKYYKELRNREVKYLKELDCDRKRDLDWPEQTRDGIRRILGFLIGEEPVWPSSLPVPQPAAPPQQAPAAQPP